MREADLADLYPVEPRALNQAVRRNADRFPADFMFQLTGDEAAALRSQRVILEKGRGRYSKYAPLAFTEHGVAMLSWVLHSARAVHQALKIKLDENLHERLVSERSRLGTMLTRYGRSTLRDKSTNTFGKPLSPATGF